MNLRLRRTLIAALAICATVAATPGVAAAKQKTWTFQDDMETGTWFRDEVSGPPCPKYLSCNIAKIVEDEDGAHGGTHYAWIAATDGQGTWVSLGRTIRLPKDAITCGVSLWVKLTNPGEEVTLVSLDVIRPSDMNYYTAQPIKLTEKKNSVYKLAATDLFEPNSRDIYVRLVVPGHDYRSVRVAADDLEVECSVPVKTSTKP